ncbi:MAG: hypothetical protein Q9227_003159 [Pyrenula ochraceoflavens]
MEHQIYSSAQKGFQDALAYDTHRPSYPAITINKLLSLLPTDTHHPLKVVDLAAGTGKFTELLAADTDEVKAVEPQRQMREVLDKKSLKRVEVLDGTAAEMRGVSLVSFSRGITGVVIHKDYDHRFANTDMLREVHRVLVPNGVLFLLWNEEDYNSQTNHQPTTRWETEMRNIAWTFDDKQRKFRNASWQDVFAEAKDAYQDKDINSAPQALFDLPLQKETTTWTVWLTKQELWDRLSTLSFIASLADSEQKACRLP